MWCIQIGADFERKLLSGQPADIQVIADGRNSNTADTATGYVGAVVESFNARWRADHGLRMARASRSRPATWYNPNLETRWHMIPSLIGTLTLLQTMLLTAMSVAREREQGTFDQLLVTPFRPVEIMAGKSLPSMLVGTGAGDRQFCSSRNSGFAFPLPDRSSRFTWDSASSCSPPSASGCSSPPSRPTCSRPCFSPS